MESNISITIGYSDFTFESCNYWCEDGYELTDKGDSVFVQCGKCGRYYFSGIVGIFTCQVCGAYDGDHYFNVACYGDHPWRLAENYYEVLQALYNAKQARFEHGETPYIKRR